MTDGFEILVDQTPGIITWNFEALKTALQEKMSEYTGIAYTEDTVKDAKKDIAELRKLKKELEDKRKEIKNTCLAPYQLIEAQAKELSQLIDAPINEIDKTIKEYEEQRKAAIREEINAYMESVASDLPDDVLKRFKEKFYDSRWENATTARKLWKTAIDTTIDIIHKEIDTINTIEEEFRDDVMRVYKKNLILAEAMEKANELRKVKAEVLERERRRELQRQIDEAKQNNQTAEPIPDPITEPTPEPTPEPVSEPIPEPVRQDGKKTVTLRITADEDQINRICAFIPYIGASYVEVI